MAGLFGVKHLSPGGNIAVGLIVVAVVLLGLVLISRLVKQRIRRRLLQRLKAVELSGVDEMSGTEFEKYIQEVLVHRDWKVRQIGGSGDLGADLGAEREKSRCVVQCKRRSNPVNRTAVSDAVASKARYRCCDAMVVTNSTFTKGAIELARANQCRLVDREALTNWILDFQGRSTVSPDEGTREMAG